MKVRDVMSPNPFALPPSASVAAAAVALAESKVGGCPVVDKGRVLGMLTELNILEALKTQHKELKMLMPAEISFGVSFVEIVSTREAASAFADVGDWPVERIMTREFAHARPDDEIERVIQIMVRDKVHRVPVLDKGALVGIVTRGDILKGFFRTL